MTVVSSKEFVSNGEKYFDLAENEELFVKRNNMMFIVSRDTKEYLEPDEDFRRAISAEDFRKRLVVSMDKIDNDLLGKWRKNLSDTLHCQ